MSKRMLVEYVKRPEAVHCSTEFIKSVMRTFKGRKAKTEVEKLVKSYIQNQKVGIMLAETDVTGTEVGVSYAQWNQYMDGYDKEMMIEVALERLVKFKQKPDDFTPEVPFDVAKQLPVFMDRCRRYFQGAKFPKWTDKYKV